MTTPSQGPGRNEGPGEEPGSHRLSTAQKLALLEFGRSNLLEFFEDGLKSAGLERLTTSAEQRFRERHIQAISSHIAEELRERNPDKQDSVFYRILAVAQDEKANYALLALEGLNQPAAYCIGMGGELVELTPGAHAGQLVRIPHGVPPEKFHASVAYADGSPHRSSARFFMAPKGLSLEARRFASGDLQGLLGDIFATEVRALSTAETKSWEISGGVASGQDRSRFAFSCSSKEVGHLLFEVGVDEETGEVFESLSRPIRPVRACSNDVTPQFRPAERAPRSLDKSLALLGYKPVELLGYPNRGDEPEPFMQDLRNVWQGWNPGCTWSLHLPGCYAKPNAPLDSFLLETYLLDRDGQYLVPFLRGSHTFTSTEPISIVCEARLDQDDPRGVKYRYIPRMIKLPSESPVEQLVAHSLESFPHSLIGFYSLIAIRDELDSRRVDWLTSGAHGYMIPSSESTSSSPTQSGTPLHTEPARILCFHSRGAHTVSVEVTEGGLIDLRRGIYAEHFFPELPPFKATT